MQKQPPKLETITGKELLSRPIEPLSFTIESILPHGLFILAGSVKIGKSWLALDMCRTVTVGGNLWDYPTTQCDTLYLALEDNNKRLQERLNKLSAYSSGTTADIYFVTKTQKLDSGLAEQLTEFLDAHTHTKLVVIDTLQHIRNNKNFSGTYSGDYRDMDALRRIVSDRNLTMLLITHTHKSNAADPLNRVIGSTGLIGAVDELKTRNANIFDAFEILKSLVGMDNKAAQLTGITDRELTIYDVLDILKGIVGMGEPVKMFIPAAVWEEVEISDVKIPVQSGRLSFDLRRIITGQSGGAEDFYFNTYFFSGTIVGLKEFNNSWIDESGTEHGPFTRTIIDVRVNKEYHGKSPIEGDTIRVFYNMSLSWLFENSVIIEEGGEYVFATWVLDKTYADYEEKYNRESMNSGANEMADVIMGGAWNTLLPIEDGKVIAFSGYFSHDENSMKRTLPSETFRTSRLTTPDSVERGWYVAMSISDFETEFLKLFENPRELPTVERRGD